MIIFWTGQTMKDRDETDWDLMDLRLMWVKLLMTLFFGVDALIYTLVFKVTQ